MQTNQTNRSECKIMSRNIDDFFYGENTDNEFRGDIYYRVKELYFGIGKTIIDIYRDEIVSLMPTIYKDKTISFVSEGIERYLIFGELGIKNNKFINDVDIVRTVNDNTYNITLLNSDELDLVLIRKDLLFQEGINNERLGLSLLTECSRELKRYNLVLDAITIAIKAKSVDVIKGDVSSFSLTNGIKATTKRMTEINKIKGFFSTLFLQSDEEFITHDKSLSNIDRTVDKIELALCAVSKIPYYRLFGKVASSQKYSGVEEKKAFQKSINPLISIANKLLEYSCKQNNIRFEEITTPQLDIEQEQVIKTSLENLKVLIELEAISNEEKKFYLSKRGII